MFLSINTYKSGYDGSTLQTIRNQFAANFMNDGYLSIMKGSMPTEAQVEHDTLQSDIDTDLTLALQPWYQDNTLVRYQCNWFTLLWAGEEDQENIATYTIIDTNNRRQEAIASGTATWFIKYQNQDGYPGNQKIFFGTVGLEGSGSDLMILDTNIVAGDSVYFTKFSVEVPTIIT